MAGFTTKINYSDHLTIRDQVRETQGKKKKIFFIKDKMMILNVRRTIVILVILMIISTTTCDARPKKSEKNSKAHVVARMERIERTFLEPLPFIGTSIALSVGKKLQRYGLGILVAPMLRIANFLYKIHLWLK